ncbi:molybdenum cofactor biosynthesis protein A [gamma proteobacterium HTCC5015]|nr:molybdenum cofactor biosynthesis protein A [gamma proteobacterium HTCC5015]
MTEWVDAFGRKVTYVRLSVTDRCDLRCRYCMPEGFSDYHVPDHWLSVDEWLHLVGALARGGVQKVRITGGEPLLRRELPELIEGISQIEGIEDIALSTNGVRLKQHARRLKAAGLNRLNISLDTLDPERFAAITGGKLSKVLSGIDAALEAGFEPIKINAVWMPDSRGEDVEGLLGYCLERGLLLRLIEAMPIGDTGREQQTRDGSVQALLKAWQNDYGLVPSVNPGRLAGGGPARYWQFPDGGTVGVITPMSDRFCASCNRIRIAVDGTLYPCLGQNDATPLREWLRENPSDRALDQQLQTAIWRKPERHHFNERPEQVVRFMSMTGG